MQSKKPFLKILAWAGGLALLVPSPAPAQAAGQTGNPDIAALVEQLKSNDGPVHLQAYEKLRALGPGAAAAVPALIGMLGTGTFFWDGLDEGGRPAHGSVPHSEHAAVLLAAVGKPAVEPLLRYVRTAKMSGSTAATDGRAWAMRALARIPDERTAAVLMPFLDDRSADGRTAAIEALLALASPPVLDRLARTLEAGGSDRRDAAAWILIRKKDERVWPYIQAKIRSPYYDIRLEAVRHLEDLGGTRAVAALSDLRAKDDHPDVREAAAAALGRLTGKPPDRPNS